MTRDDPAALAVARETARYCEEYDDGAATLETILEVDESHERWTFEDVPLDSGTFGEVVSRGIVRKCGDAYRVASREGVRAGLDGTEADLERAGGDETGSGRRWHSSSIDPRATGALALALAVLFATRLLAYRSVFREGHVVSPGNDPYHYRYWNERLLATSDGRTDWRLVASLPEGTRERRPFTHAANWFVAELLGGGEGAAEMVAAWLPPIATVALGVVVYYTAVRATDDVRVGVASVLLLALTPVHAVYTGAGFLEHRLYQYCWLGLVLSALVWLAADLERRVGTEQSGGSRRRGERERAIDTRGHVDRETATRGAVSGHLRSPRTWVAALVLGGALGVSMHTWGGSILLLAPVAAYVGLKAACDVRTGVNPALANAPAVAGLGVGAGLSAAFHRLLEWHEPFVAVVPAVVAVGAALALLVADAWRRLEWPVGGLLGSEVLLAGGCVAAIRLLRPGDWSRLIDRAADLFFRSGATEATSLFSAESAVIYAPIEQIGLWFYLALPVLGWAWWRGGRRYEPRLLVLAVASTFWLALAAMQTRFGAHLAISLAPFGGVGVVWLLTWVDLARPPAPVRSRECIESLRARTARETAADGGSPRPSIVVPRERRSLVAIASIGLVIAASGIVFLPTMYADAAHDDRFDAAMAIETHAAETGREYPENYVLSEWGDNRMHNYFVNGESRSYGFASTHFEDFVTGTDPDGWYEQWRETDVGYVVVTDVEGDPPTTSTQAKLYRELGTGTESGDALAHYRAIYLGDDAAAFAVVPGAVVSVTGEPGEKVAVESDVTVSDHRFTYRRTGVVDEDGQVALRVPYPGTYDVNGDALEVTPEAVDSGETVAIG